MTPTMEELSQMILSRTGRNIMASVDNTGACEIILWDGKADRAAYQIYIREKDDQPGSFFVLVYKCDRHGNRGQFVWAKDIPGGDYMFGEVLRLVQDFKKKIEKENTPLSATPLVNEPELRFGQLSDGQTIWLKAKDDLKTFDDAQLKGRPNLMAELESAEAVYDSESNSVTIISSPTKDVIGLTLPMPMVVELFNIIPPNGIADTRSDDPLHKNPTDNRNFMDPKIIPEPYENTLDYITPTSKGDGYRAGQVTQADHASKGIAPMVPRTRTVTKEKGFRGIVLPLKEEDADEHPERVTRELMDALKGGSFSPLRIWWEKPDRGRPQPEYDTEESDNPRLHEIEIDWPAFQKDLNYRRAVFETWSFLLGQGRYPYFV